METEARDPALDFQNASSTRDAIPSYADSQAPVRAEPRPKHKPKRSPLLVVFCLAEVADDGRLLRGPSTRGFKCASSALAKQTPRRPHWTRTAVVRCHLDPYDARMVFECIEEFLPNQPPSAASGAAALESKPELGES
jgi:hypothetical protein